MENTIINGDCKKIFPEIKDKYKNILVLTDPPYNINFRGYEDYNKDGYKDNLTKKEYVELLSTFKDVDSAIIHYPEETMEYVVPALGIPQKVLAWCYPSNIGRRFRLINIYGRKPDFTKVKQPYKNPTDKRVRERMESGAEGSPLYDWFTDINIVKNVSKEKLRHPCQIPVSLMIRLIKLLVKEDDIVVDPFMGVVTTAIACISEKINYIGIELSKKYCEIAEKRIKKCKRKHFDLFEN